MIPLRKANLSKRQSQSSPCSVGQPFKRVPITQRQSINLRGCSALLRSGVRVVVVRLETNCGPAAARNVGLRAVRRLGVQLACFLDADCVPEVRHSQGPTQCTLWLSTVNLVCFLHAGRALLAAQPRQTAARNELTGTRLYRETIAG
jgi:glycosyltransferase involved in cell wall biosynthesis